MGKKAEGILEASFLCRFRYVDGFFGDDPTSGRLSSDDDFLGNNGTIEAILADLDPFRDDSRVGDIRNPYRSSFRFQIGTIRMSLDDDISGIAYDPPLFYRADFLMLS